VGFIGYAGKQALCLIEIGNPQIHSEQHPDPTLEILACVPLVK